MSKQLTRKQFLTKSAQYAAGVAVGGAGLNLILREKSFAKSSATTWPWPYQELDPEKVRILGHDSYYGTPGGCCYGAFNSIIQALRDTVGEPFASLPSELMYYGSGGAAGWGTLCGAINGSGAAISLVSTKANTSTLVGELLGWYTQTEFPTDTSNQYAADSKYTINKVTSSLPQNKSGSPLCHISVSEWCKTADMTSGSAERLDRCARLTGDVAAYAVKILNDMAKGSFTPLYVAPGTVAGCKACHATGAMATVVSNMECTQCHGDPHAQQGVTEAGGIPVGYSLNQNYPNPFNPSTQIKFSVPSREAVTLSIYDVHGRLVKRLVDQAVYSPGNYLADWDGTNMSGQRVASGTYFARIIAGSFRKAVKMSLMK